MPRAVSNLLGLAVLSYLTERPMHAYELNRTLKLMTPFGGGKSHTLASLFHAARTRSSKL